MRICIFCGANNSTDVQVPVEIKNVMKFFAENNIELVYGGANVGIMGALANELINLGGKVTGVMPQQLMHKEVTHGGLTKIHIVKDMHERKKLMYDLSDAFLIFPGGMGTLDELFEITTWKQIGIHHKPIAILNVSGYYDHLLKFLDHGVDKNLIKEKDRNFIYSSKKWNDIWEYFDKEISR
ncbi:MAG: TIGR00730 family Rossman fold protein [Bacteriovoracaceae bacterium]